MVLTSAQRKLLLRYRVLRGKPPGVGGFLGLILIPIAGSVGLVAISSAVFPPMVTLFIAGLLTGVVLRNIALVVHAVRLLPAVFRVIDWDKLDQLLDGPSRTA